MLMDKPIDDPFLKKFLSRVPEAVADSYTDAQLDAIKLAYGARTRGAHLVDIRLSVPWITRRFYVVLLAGGERRPADRRALERALRPLGTVANVVLMGLLAIGFAVSLFAVLYSVKMALGIDVFPGIDMLPDAEIQRLLR